MEKNGNFLQRTVNALIEGRTRQAERYVAQFERQYGRARKDVNAR